MLDIVGKIFERITFASLEADIQQAEHLSDNRFGFRISLPTYDAIESIVSLAENAVSIEYTKRICAIIGLDVRNSFNATRWDGIMLTLKEISVTL